MVVMPVKTVAMLVNAELKQAPTRSVYLCGESFGGCLALHMALHSPQLFSRIILVNPASSLHRRPWIAWGSQMARYLPESFYRLSSVALMPLLANLERIPLRDRHAFITAVQSVPQTTAAWRLALLEKFYITEENLSQLSQSVLLLASTGDRLLPSLEEANYLARILPNAQVVILPDSGHACLLEADVNLYAILRTQGFLLD